ncbi:MAG: hypothetical protein M0C28_00795 [Candidatus Moduliflexus flocculans]|nr:hypothetical protein [Candidatus Moduliflexus flocculans]
MMSVQLCLITCASFDREILAVQSSPDLQDVRFRIHPVDCDQVGVALARPRRSRGAPAARTAARSPWPAATV